MAKDMTAPAKLPEFDVTNLLGARFPVIIEDAVEITECDDCGKEEFHIPKLKELSQAVAVIRASMSIKLNPVDVKHLRKSCDLRAKDLADLLSATPEHVSRIENGKKVMSEAHERILRLYTCLKFADATLRMGITAEDVVNIKPKAAFDVTKTPELRLQYLRVEHRCSDDQVDWMPEDDTMSAA